MVVCSMRSRFITPNQQVKIIIDWEVTVDEVPLLGIWTSFWVVLLASRRFGVGIGKIIVPYVTCYNFTLNNVQENIKQYQRW